SIGAEHPANSAGDTAAACLARWKVHAMNKLPQSKLGLEMAAGQRLQCYLWEVYRRDILGQQGRVEMPELDEELIANAKAEMARIDALRLGTSLASRDFASYQNRRALAGLLAYWEEQDAPRP